MTITYLTDMHKIYMHSKISCFTNVIRRSTLAAIFMTEKDKAYVIPTEFAG